MAFTVHPFDAAIGAEIRGIDLSGPLTEEEFVEIELAFYEHSVIVFRDQELEPAQYVRFGEGLGEVAASYADPLRMEGFPQILLNSNVTEGKKQLQNYSAGRYWHTDRSYMPAPSQGSALYAVEVPFDGDRALGDTLFASTAHAFEALPDDVRGRIEHLSAKFALLHQREKLIADGHGKAWWGSTSKSGRAEKLVAKHRLVQQHPITDRQFLFVNEAHMVEILDVPGEEGAELMAALCEHVTREEFVYRHQWRVGDVLMWDNLPLVHRATFDYEKPQRRVLQRITWKGPRLP